MGNVINFFMVGFVVGLLFAFTIRLVHIVKDTVSIRKESFLD